MIQRLLLLAAVVLLVVAALVFGQDIVHIFSDPGELRNAILRLGPWGPLGLIVLSALQIVLAPIPGYLVQITGGYLFGAWLGTFYGIVGMLLGAAAAFLLSRRFGVPFLERLIPQRLLNGWLHLRNLSSLTTWFIILLLPVGDFCYFLAGLTALSLPRMLFLTLVVRGPTVFIATFAGAKVTGVPTDVLWLLAALAIVVTALVLWQKDNIEMLIFDRLLVRIFGKRDEENGK